MNDEASFRKAQYLSLLVLFLGFGPLLYQAIQFEQWHFALGVAGETRHIASPKASTCVELTFEPKVNKVHITTGSQHSLLDCSVGPHDNFLEAQKVKVIWDGENPTSARIYQFKTWWFWQVFLALASLTLSIAVDGIRRIKLNDFRQAKLIQSVGHRVKLQWVDAVEDWSVVVNRQPSLNVVLRYDPLDQDFEPGLHNPLLLSQVKYIPRFFRFKLMGADADISNLQTSRLEADVDFLNLDGKAYWIDKAQSSE